MFSGHFPGNPIVPGVILTEALAQAAGIAAASDYPETARPLFLLSAIRTMKFLQAVRPGDQIDLHAEKIAGEMRRISFLRDVQFEQTLDYPTVEVNIDREKAETLGVSLLHADFAATNYAGAFEFLAPEKTEAIFASRSGAHYINGQTIAAFALAQRLPSVHVWRDIVEAGALMSYGSDYADILRRAASYVDAILKGAKPGELPVQQPVKFELIINLKTAKTLGLALPPTLLARADEIID